MKTLFLIVVVGTTAGCYERLSFNCGSDDSNCGAGGVCVGGACAFAAADCASGLRFDRSAGSESDRCVDQVSDMSINDDLGSDLGQSDLAPAADMTVTCGTPGLPCCNLTCNTGVTCTGPQCQAASFWVAGLNGTGAYSAHWDGNAWNSVTVTGPGISNILGLWGTSGSNIWAVGSSGNSPSTSPVIWHYDGSGWTPCAAGNPCTAPTTTSTQLGAVFGLSASDIWAFGGGDAVHWNGAAWTSKSTGLPAGIGNGGVWCASTSDCWIVSSQKTYHWNGSDWSTVYTVGDVYAGAAFGFATNDVWGGTGAGFSGAGSLVHWNGTAWSAPSAIQGTNNAGVIRHIWGVATNDVWAVGDNGFIAHWDGSQWSRIASNTTSGLDSVWGVASKDVWAAGSATVVHWNGTQWTASMPLGTSETLAAIWGPIP